MAAEDTPFFCLRVCVDRTGLAEVTTEADVTNANANADTNANVDEACQETADRVIAECWAAGAAGLEERAHSLGIVLHVFAPVAEMEQVVAAAVTAGGRLEAEPEPVAQLDWSESWKEGLEAIEVSPRLVVRPSFVERELVEGQREIVIDPGQAFGTGGHASTRLILEWLDALVPDLCENTRVLDVGTGTGVLALAALALGAGRAVGFDLDPRAATEARGWAERNGYADRFSVFAGGIDALRPQTFAFVLANLLRRELLPIITGVSQCAGNEGRVVLSGLLAEEQERVEEAMAEVQFKTLGARFLRDSTGDHWVSLLMGRA